MLGILFESVQECVASTYGKEVWEQIAESLEIDIDQMLSTNPYPDVLIDQIIDTLIMIKQDGDRDTLMEMFGSSFVDYFSNYGFEKILKVAGRNFRDFLYSIDQLHDSNRFTFPKMKSPLFFVESEDKRGAFLHYQSRRRGFNYYVIGQLKTCAAKFYQIEAEAYIYKDLSNDEFNHVVFRIDFENKECGQGSSFLSDGPRQVDSSIVEINCQTFLDFFPFSFGYDKELKIKYMGSIFRNLFKEEVLDKPLSEVFAVKRPTFELNWDMVLIYADSVIFELESLIDLQNSDIDPETKKQLNKLKVKGQMKHIKDLDVIFFLGHPMLDNMDEMLKIGLYLNDLNRFDGSAEMLVTELQHGQQLQAAFEAQKEWTVSLESTRKELKVWKNKGKQLLYNMLPTRIALKIENGVQPNTICETFSQVTILFLNTTDFAAIVNKAEPAEIIKFVNSTITVYDSIVTTYDKVNKIETKADGSYMVVAGLEQSDDNDQNRRNSVSSNGSRSLSAASMKTTSCDDEAKVEKKKFPEYNQVELICAVALDLIENSHRLKNPFVDDKNDNLKIKIGFHTGTIVAGIVGISNIQFCLFGDPVNTASRMCSNSLPDRALFSEDAYKYLENSKFFKSEFRDTIPVKGKGEMKTYWLLDS